MTTSAPLTFLFHDYETFGIHPAYDRPAQFAGVRTDTQFTPVDNPLVLYCQPADDYLPDPNAVMITGITPQHALQHGVNEALFAKTIHQAFSQANTCIIGYNNIRFDDEVTRHLFYRNFYDPYAYSWQNNNSRWDLIDVIRACYALRPDGICWPVNELGVPSFRLEHLTAENGINHENAHDAMSDVYATIAIAKLINQAQPKLFDYLFQMRNKNRVASLIDISTMTPLVHVSGMFGAQRGNVSWVAPLAWHPDNKNAVIVCDLAKDITPLLTLDSDTLRQHLYTRYDELAEGSVPVPLKLIHINKCPVLANAKTLAPERSEELGIDRAQCLANLQQLRQFPEVREKVLAIFGQVTDFPPTTDVDGQLYQGFFSNADRANMQIIQRTNAEHLPALDLTFNDPRIQPLLFRYRARNFPNTLSDSEQQLWLQHRKEVFTPEVLQSYLLTLDELATQYADDEQKLTLLKALFSYVQTLVG